VKARSRSSTASDACPWRQRSRASVDRRLDGVRALQPRDESRGLFLSALGKGLRQHDFLDRSPRLPRLRAPVREHRLGPPLEEAALRESRPQLFHRQARTDGRRGSRRGRHGTPAVDGRPVHFARHERVLLAALARDARNLIDAEEAVLAETPREP
jgi:hypothetical protein